MLLIDVAPTTDVSPDPEPAPVTAKVPAPEPAVSSTVGAVAVEPSSTAFRVLVRVLVAVDSANDAVPPAPEPDRARASLWELSAGVARKAPAAVTTAPPVRSASMVLLMTLVACEPAPANPEAPAAPAA